MLKARPKFWWLCIFTSSFQMAFSHAVYAESSLQACFQLPDCVALEKEALGTAVSTPTEAGVSTTVTDSSGVSVNAASDSVTVTDTGSGPGLRNGAWYYWSPSQNQNAQQLAQQKYCTANPNDSVCVPPFKKGQCKGIEYHIYGTFTGKLDPNTVISPEFGYLFGPISNIGKEVAYPNGSWGYYTDGYDSVGNPETAQVLGSNRQYTISNVSVVRVDGNPDNCGDPPPPSWKDWSQDKRDAAVALLSPTDWAQLMAAMPQGGALAPGDTINAPKVVIPGTDDPNAPDYQRLPQIMDGPYPWSGQAPSPDPDPLRGNPNNLSLNSDQLKTLQERPKYAEYARNNPHQDPNGCISATVPGHLGTEPNAPAALYATQVSGSADDYFVLSHSGAAHTFDGLTPGTNHLWEAKYDYSFLADPNYSAFVKNMATSQMNNEAIIENQVAQECNYQLTWAFSNPSVAALFLGDWLNNAAYPQDVQYIPYSNQ